MGTWNTLQKGFTVNECLPDTLVDVAVWHVFNCATQLYRQTQQIKSRPIHNFGQLWDELSLLT